MDAGAKVVDSLDNIPKDKAVSYLERMEHLWKRGIAQLR